MPPHEQALRQLLDRDEIQESLHRYARGVDRRDWQLVRETYHPDAYDDHGDYKGDVDGLVAWLSRRFSGVDSSTHFIGPCLSEFTGPDEARVETRFISHRMQPPSGDDLGTTGADVAVCRQSWGRYVDRFERRAGVWRVARRLVVVDAAYRFLVRREGGGGPGARGSVAQAAQPGSEASPTESR